MKNTIKTDAFEGTIEFKPLKFDEKKEVAEKLASHKDDPNLSDAQNQVNSLLYVSGIYNDIFQNQVTSINLKVVAEGEYSGTEITNYDDLVVFQEGIALLNDFASRIINGLILGKPKLKDSELIAP